MVKDKDLKEQMIRDAIVMTQSVRWLSRQIDELVTEVQNLRKKNEESSDYSLVQQIDEKTKKLDFLFGKLCFEKRLANQFLQKYKRFIK